jgi:hypothetical protein
MTDEIAPRPSSSAVAWFKSSTATETCLEEILSLATRHGWTWSLTTEGVDLRHHDLGLSSHLLASSIQDWPQRVLESFARECEREVEVAEDRGGVSLVPAVGPGVVVGAPGCEYSWFSGSHISERSG